MREMVEIESGTLKLPEALKDASRPCESHSFEGAFVPQLESPDLAFTVEDMTWKTPA